MTSSVKSRGWGLVKRIRSSPCTPPHRAQQPGEGTPLAELAAVGVDVLTEQGDLEHTLVDERRHLGEDVTGPAVSFPASQAGTMQKVQVLSQPTEIATQAE